MPKELLEFIRALNEYKKTAHQKEKNFEDMTLRDFVDMMTEEPSPEQPAQTPSDFVQRARAFKVPHLDGTISILDLSTSVLVEVSENAVTIVYPNTEVEFTVGVEISEDTHAQLKAYLTS